ncbi:MAG: hypothetical protein JW739_01580 [Opitutales bacterium]|nr:hypothetical protein [Opitutales bacterium]
MTKKAIYALLFVFFSIFSYAAQVFPYRVTIKVEVNREVKQLVYRVSAEDRNDAFQKAKKQMNEEIKDEVSILHFSIIRDD